MAEDPDIVSLFPTIQFFALPFGTGNDLSRSLGWGSNVKHYNIRVEELIEKILMAKEDKLALWHLKVQSEV